MGRRAACYGSATTTAMTGWPSATTSPPGWCTPCGRPSARTERPPASVRRRASAAGRQGCRLAGTDVAHRRDPLAEGPHLDHPQAVRHVAGDLVTVVGGSEEEVGTGPTCP